MHKGETQVSEPSFACCERTKSPGYNQENKTHCRCLLVTKEIVQCKQAKQRSLDLRETLLWRTPVPQASGQLGPRATVVKCPWASPFFSWGLSFPSCKIRALFWLKWLSNCGPGFLGACVYGHQSYLHLHLICLQETCIHCQSSSPSSSQMFLFNRHVSSQTFWGGGLSC